VSNEVKKKAVRAGTIAAVAPLTLLLPSPAFAGSSEGEDPGPGLSVIQTLGLYVALPILLFLVIAGLVVLSEKTRKKG
jgi:hypothetical protein